MIALPPAAVYALYAVLALAAVAAVRPAEAAQRPPAKDLHDRGLAIVLAGVAITLVVVLIDSLGEIHVLVNNAYLGLIRQSQRGFDMDYCVQLAFDNVNAPEVGGYGVDHVKVAEGLGCKAVRVKSPNEFKEAFATAKQLMAEHQVPVVLEFILERVTNISMGTDLHNVSEFEEILCLDPSLRIDQVSGSVLEGAGAGAAPAR